MFREGERSYARISQTRRIRPPLRDLMDWNEAKVDHVIASRTRLEEIGIEELRFVPKRHIHLSMKNGPGLHRVFAELLSISCNFLPKSIG